MPDLDDKVRLVLRETVAGLSPSPELDDRVRRRVRRRERQHRLATAATVATVAVALAGATVTALSLPAGDAPSVVAGDGGGAGDPSGTLFLLADPPPDGFELGAAMGGDGPPSATAVEISPGWEGTLRLVDFDGDEHPERIVDVQWGPAPEAERAERTDPLARLRAAPGVIPTVVATRAALAAPAAGWLARVGDDGRAVRVAGQVAPEGPDLVPGTPLDAGVLGAVAEALVPRDGPGYDVPEPPEGFDVVAEWPGVASTGTNSRVALYRSAGEKAHFFVQVVDGSEVPPGAGLDTAAARRVQLRGNEAVLTHRMLPAHVVGLDDAIVPIGDLFVHWTEPGGELVTVGGKGLGEAELLAVADSLVAVDAGEWFALVRGAGDGEMVAPAPPPSAPATSDPVPPTATVAPSGGGAVAGTERVNGSYSGTEHYTFSAGECPDLDHVLESTFELDDGTVWDYRSEYCGDLDGDRWSGSGTFTFTTPGGDTITGTTDVGWVPVPSSGGPVLLTVTGGTGRYDGATGACELDNHITQEQIGVQRQYGTFTCIIAP